MLEGEKPTSEKLLGIQAEWFPAEPEKRALLPIEKICFNNKFAFVVKKEEKKEREKKKLMWFFISGSPNISKQTWHLSVFQLIYFVEKKILSNIGEHVLSHLHKYIFC